MVYTCFLCKWRSDKQPRRSYHKFPSNFELKQKWLDICGKSNVSIGERTSLCNIHFEEDCFRYGLVMGRKILKDGSIPTLHISKSGKVTPSNVHEIKPKSENTCKYPIQSLIDNSDMKNPPSKSTATWFDESTELETKDILMEIPVEFSPHKGSPRKRICKESLENPNKSTIQQPHDIECRVCLQKYNHESGLMDIFKPWKTPWNGMGNCIAQDLSQIADIEIKSTDPFSKLICQYCHQKLLEACSFVVNVRSNDRLLWHRVGKIHKQKRTMLVPIQKSESNEINALRRTMDVEVKQEALSDEDIYEKETDETLKYDIDGPKSNNRFSNWEIKVEHDEINTQNPKSLNGTHMGKEVEQNSVLLIGDHKQSKRHPEAGQLVPHGEANQSNMIYQRYAGRIEAPCQGVPHIPPEVSIHHHWQTQTEKKNFVGCGHHRQSNRQVP